MLDVRADVGKFKDTIDLTRKIRLNLYMDKYLWLQKSKGYIYLVGLTRNDGVHRGTDEVRNLRRYVSNTCH
jgi:hypothetical protein